MRRALSFLGLAGVLALAACGTSRHDDGEGSGARGGSGQSGRAGGSSVTAGNGASGRGGTSATAGVGGGAGSGAGAAGRGTAGGSSSGGATSAGTAGQGVAGRVDGEAGGAGASGEAGAGGEGVVLPTRGGGHVTLAVFANRQQETQFTQASAGFWEPSAPAPSACVRETFGSCTVSTCPTAASTDPAPPITNPDAGYITFASTQVGYSKELIPDSAGAYAGDVDTTLLWAGGESVSLSAPGAEVPAFDATATMPIPLVVERSDLAADTDDGFLPFDATQDLVLDFSNGKAGVTIQVSGSSGYSGQATSTALYCSFESAPGTLTVPAAALAALATMAYPVVYLYTVGRTDVSVGNYDVMLIFGMPMNDSEGHQLAFATH